MPQEKVDIILHPIRLRILLTLAGRHLTAQQLAQTLPDVSQATLYRHIHQLVDADLLSIDETRPVRGGMVEKVYTLAQENIRLTKEDITSLSREDHLRSFTVFFMSVLRDFEQYIQQEQIDFASEVRYHQVPLYLSDDEFQDVMHAFTILIQAQQNNQPLPGRRRRMLTSIILPVAETIAPGDE